LNPSSIGKVLSTLRKHRVRALLMRGQACILSGAAEFSRDVDLAVLPEPKNLEKLERALAELQAEQVFVLALDRDVLLRGHACHFRLADPDVQRPRSVPRTGPTGNPCGPSCSPGDGNADESADFADCAEKECPVMPNGNGHANGSARLAFPRRHALPLSAAPRRQENIAALWMLKCYGHLTKKRPAEKRQVFYTTHSSKKTTECGNLTTC